MSSSVIPVAAGALLGSCFTLACIKLIGSKRRTGNEKVHQNAYELMDDSYKSGLQSDIESMERSLKQQSYRISSDQFLLDEVISEQFTRNSQFFGRESQLLVHKAFVVVIGLGGVGSHAAAMLLRSGVGRLRLVDFDQVSLSSLNRHAVAVREDVGLPKATCLRDHFLRIFPECQIEARAQLYEDSSEEDILCDQPDFVLDCIDNIQTKVSLLAACVRRGLKVISATGAGARADPTRIRIADLSESSVDRLSRAVRQRLRRDHGIESGIPVVFSTEKPKAKLLPFTGPNGEDANPLDYQVVPGFRVRIIPVMGTIPAMFGQVMASFVITKIANMQVNYEPIVPLDLDHCKTLHQRLVEREEIRFGTADGVEVDVEDVAFVVREIWKGRSARDQQPKADRRGMWRIVNHLSLTRWDSSQPASVKNLVLLTFDEAEEHEAMELSEIRERDPGYFDMVSEALQRGAWEYGFMT